MSDNKRIYCNITECFFNRPLDEVHTKKGRPGFTPLVASMDEYVGFCVRGGIEVTYGVFTSPGKRVQKIAYCESIVLSDDIEYRKSADNDATWSIQPSPGEVDQVYAMTCKVYDCAFNTASKRGEVGGCRKIDEDAPIYVDEYRVYDGNDEFVVARCSSQSNRLFEGHIDWGSAANPMAGSYKAFPKQPTRPSIRGKW